MGPSLSKPKAARFGLFEADLDQRILAKAGLRVKLQDQPFQVLAMLLERPGDLVTRDEIRQRLWPSNTYVEFDDGLNTAIKKLRAALGDAADNPRFVETIPRRGYRFLAPVTSQASLHQTGPQETEMTLAETFAFVHTASLENKETLPDPGGAVVSEKVSRSDIVAARRGDSSASGERWKPKHRHLRVLSAVAASAIVLLCAYFLRPTRAALRINRIVKLTRSGEAFPLERLLTDGPRVYYPAQHFHQRQVLLNGNEDVFVTSWSSDLAALDLSPDDTQFLARRPGDEETPIWILPIVGGAARRVGNLLAHDAAWCRDGARVVYARESQILLANADGSGEHLLVAVPGWATHLRWSPDGHRLRFTVIPPAGSRSIWEVGADGKHLRELRQLGPMAASGVWTKDGRYFVFQSWRDGIYNLWAIEEKSDWLHRMNRDPMQLTTGPMTYYSPLPSRDGNALFAMGAQLSGELLRYDPKRKEFVPFLGGLSADDAEFTKDGQWVTYVMYPEGTLWLARGDGSQELQLTFPPLSAMEPHWSPDGSRIGFVARRPGEAWKIYAISTDGGAAQPLLSDPSWQGGLQWLPAGNSVLCSRTKDPENLSDLAIYQLDLSTGVTKKVGGTEGFYEVIPSPNDRYQVAVDIKHQLFLFESKTGKKRLLSSRLVQYPHWSADSRYIYFNTIFSPEPALFRVRAADGQEEKITDVRFVPAGIFGPPGSGLAPDGSPLITRNHNAFDVYELFLSTP